MVIACESLISWLADAHCFFLPSYFKKSSTNLLMMPVLHQCQDAYVWRNQASFFCLPVVPQNKGKSILFVHLLSSPAKHAFS
jgi:hypothetical protein